MYKGFVGFNNSNKELVNAIVNDYKEAGIVFDYWSETVSDPTDIRYKLFCIWREAVALKKGSKYYRASVDTANQVALKTFDDYIEVAQYVARVVLFGHDKEINNLIKEYTLPKVTNKNTNDSKAVEDPITAIYQIATYSSGLEEDSSNPVYQFVNMLHIQGFDINLFKIRCQKDIQATRQILLFIEHEGKQVQADQPRICHTRKNKQEEVNQDNQEDEKVESKKKKKKNKRQERVTIVPFSVASVHKISDPNADTEEQDEPDGGLTRTQYEVQSQDFVLINIISQTKSSIYNPFNQEIFNRFFNSKPNLQKRLVLKSLNETAANLSQSLENISKIQGVLPINARLFKSLIDMMKREGVEFNNISLKSVDSEIIEKVALGNNDFRDEWIATLGQDRSRQIESTLGFALALSKWLVGFETEEVTTNSELPEKDLELIAKFEQKAMVELPTELIKGLGRHIRGGEYGDHLIQLKALQLEVADLSNRMRLIMLGNLDSHTREKLIEKYPFLNSNLDFGEGGTDIEKAYKTSKKLTQSYQTGDSIDTVDFFDSAMRCIKNFNNYCTQHPQYIVDLQQDIDLISSIFVNVSINELKLYDIDEETNNPKSWLETTPHYPRRLFLHTIEVLRSIKYDEINSLEDLQQKLEETPYLETNVISNLKMIADNDKTLQIRLLKLTNAFERFEDFPSISEKMGPIHTAKSDKLLFYSTVLDFIQQFNNFVNDDFDSYDTPNIERVLKIIDTIAIFARTIDYSIKECKESLNQIFTIENQALLELYAVASGDKKFEPVNFIILTQRIELINIDDLKGEVSQRFGGSDDQKFDAEIVQAILKNINNVFERFEADKEFIKRKLEELKKVVSGEVENPDILEKFITKIKKKIEQHGVNLVPISKGFEADIKKNKKKTKKKKK